MPSVPAPVNVRRRIPTWVLVLQVLSLAGCGGAPGASSPVTPAGQAKRPAVHVDRPRVAARAQVQRLLRQVVAAYRDGRWSRVRDVFVSPAAGTGLVSQLTAWRMEGVRGLRAVPVSVAAISPRRYVATLEFSADPRAIPAYDLYTAVWSAGSIRLSAPFTGLPPGSGSGAWTVTASRHYRVYHSPFELRGADRRFLAALERQRTQFVRKFALRPPEVTRYYYYPRQNMIRAATRGACGATAVLVGCALPARGSPEIHTSEWPSYHEPVHIFQMAMEPSGYEAPMFIAEGMAVALENRELDPRRSDYCSDLAYVPLDRCAARAAPGVNPGTLLTDRGFSRGDPSISYLLSGSFVKYLILTGGYRRFGRFYYVLAAQPSDRRRDYDVAARRVYGVAMSVLLRRWREALCGECSGPRLEP